MEDQEIKELLARYQSGNATEQDKAFLESWYQQQNLEWFDLSDQDRLQDADLIWDQIKLQTNRKHTYKLWPRIAKAASVLLLLSAGAYFLKLKSKDNQQIANTRIQDIAPGSNKAILTLSNGKQIIVTGAKTGLLVNEGHTAINIKSGGEVVYSDNSQTSSTTVQYNTMTTPRGGQYHLVLADGTNAWLNAASTITYPTEFAGKNREVKITGEVYFEVAHNKEHPFLVKTSGQTITVLGTHFNVNAYNDEPATKTTLLEGSVRVNAGVSTSVIKPGQQAILYANKLSVNEVDTDDVIAWKNGMFQFSDENLESIMRKLSRWYNVDVEYENTAVKEIPLTGIITHFSNISKVLRMLELTKQVHFKIDGQKIIVTK